MANPYITRNEALRKIITIPRKSPANLFTCEKTKRNSYSSALNFDQLFLQFFPPFFVGDGCARIWKKRFNGNVHSQDSIRGDSLVMAGNTFLWICLDVFMCNCVSMCGAASVSRVRALGCGSF